MTDSVVLHPVSVRPAEAAVVTVMEGAVGAHVGLLCLAADGTHRHLDLAWHLRLQDTQDPPADAFWVESQLTKYQLADIAFSARMIARRQQSGRIPYAFARNPEFDSEGTLQLNQSLGLTCATFVLRVFQHARIQLLDETTWDLDRSAERKQEDIAAQRELVERLRSKPEYRSHADLVEGEVGCTRIRAEEVAAASGMTGRPISFARAEPEGRRVLAKIGKPRAGAA